VLPILMEAPHDPLYAGFHPQGHPMGLLGLIEPLDPLDLDARKLRAFFEAQKVWSSYNSGGMCDFAGAPLNGLEFLPMLDYIDAVTGWNMSLYELMKVGSATTRWRRCSTSAKASRRTTTCCRSRCTKGSATVR
jgi:aldehyde:ferredoxin oxidoreductase